MRDKDGSAMTERCSQAEAETSLGDGVRQLRAGDVAGAASLHCRVFPDYFSTHMGQRFVERFYAEFVGGGNNYGFVAVSDGELAGVVVGTADSTDFYGRLYRRHFPGLALALAGRVIVDPYIRRHLSSRMGHIRLALRSILARNRRVSVASVPADPDQVPARLLSICVELGVRGSGLAEKLVDRYCDALWEDGWERVGLSVRPDNQRAIAFYEKTGWQRVGASDSSVQYVRSTKPAAGGPR